MDFNDYVNQSYALLQKGKYADAIEQLEKAKSINDNPDIQNLIKMAKQLAGANTQAAQSLENEARHKAESIGIKVEDVDREIDNYKKLAMNDDSAKNRLSILYYIRGLTFSAKGEYARAVADYTNTIEYEPDSVNAYNKRGQAHSDNGDFDSAIKDFKELIRLQEKFNQDNNTAKNQLADAYCKRGMEYDGKRDYARAVSDYEEALKYKPDDGSIRELLEMAKAEIAKH